MHNTPPDTDPALAFTDADPVRDVVLRARVTGSEREQAERYAEQRGMTVSEIIRAAFGLDKTRSEEPMNMSRATRTMKEMSDVRWSHGYLRGIIDTLEIIGGAGSERLFVQVIATFFGNGEPTALIAVAADDPNAPIWDYLQQFGYIPEPLDDDHEDDEDEHMG